MCLLSLDHGGITVHDNDCTRRFCHFLKTERANTRENIVVTFCWKPLQGMHDINDKWPVQHQFLPVLDFSAFDCISFQISENFTNMM